MDSVHNGIPASRLLVTAWRKSRHSNPSGNCVELAELNGGSVAVRNSRDPDGPALIFTPAEWEAFVDGVRDGDFADFAGNGDVRPEIEHRLLWRDFGIAWETSWSVIFAGGPMILAEQPEGAPDRTLSAISGGGGPTVLRILLGTQLRRLRESRRISLAEAGNAIRASHSKISRLETGRVSFKDRDIRDLLTLYGVTDEQDREALRALARRAGEPGWWQDYSDILPGWFETYVGLEEAATQIREYEVQFVPGLLQTEDYARAVTRLGHVTAPAAEIERRVRLRMARQVLLTKPDPPNLWVVLDEAVLRRPAGGQEVMRGQLAHLLELSRRPRVTIQVIPFQAGGHAAAGGAFSILRFAEPDLPDVVYLEQLTSALYLDKPEAVEDYLAVMERVCTEAATPAASASLIEEILRGSASGR